MTLRIREKNSKRICFSILYMVDAEIDYAVDPGSGSDEETNEDFLWIGPEEGINAVLILDGTSGTAEDFGAANGKTGGRRYVEKFGESVKNLIKENSDIELEEVMKSAIRRVWEDFEKQAEINKEKYFDGNDVVLQRASTVPAAVGALIRWDEQKLELIHVGDVETCIVKETGCEEFSNQVHEKFDELRDQYIEEYGRNSEEVDEIVSKHRSAHNLPGTYPNISFNPLAVEKLGEKNKFDIKEVQKILLSTDGASPRIRKLLEPENNKEVIKSIKRHGAESIIEKLRRKEEKSNLNQLKTSDDAAIALVEF